MRLNDGHHGGPQRWREPWPCIGDLFELAGVSRALFHYLLRGCRFRPTVSRKTLPLRFLTGALPSPAG